jgi:hypothetical protein
MKYIDQIDPPLLSPYPLPLPLVPSPNKISFTFLSSFVQVCSLFRGVLPWYFTCEYVVL